MAQRILITPRSLSSGAHPVLQPLRDAGYELVYPAPGETPSEAALIDAVGDCVGWLAGVEPVSEAVIDAAVHLKAISRNGAGVDNLPVAALEKKGITLHKAQGANARGVSELALALTLSGLRDIVTTAAGMKAGDWPRRIGHEIEDAEIGVVGLGAIGGAYADFCLKLGARVRGFDPFAPDIHADNPKFTRGSMEETLDGAQVISLHAPMPQDGVPLIGAEQLDLLATGAVVVNTARAGLVDKDAMFRSLQSGKVGTYATDVFETEPPSLDPLLEHPRVIMTSHIGGFTVGSVKRSAGRAVDNLLKALA